MPKKPEKTFDETICRKVHLISSADHVRLTESVERSQTRLNFILNNLTETRLDENEAERVYNIAFNEAVRLERLMICESAADKDFFALQKNFRSMVRAGNVLVKWFPGSAMSGKMEQLRTMGIELLGELYEHIKDLEAGANQEKAGVKLDKDMAKARDQFMKIYADFATVFRGMMTVADLFAEDPSSVGGYSDLKGIFHALEQDHMLTDEPLGKALAIYDESAGKRNAMPGKTGIPDNDGFLSKLFGRGNKKGKSLQKFQAAIAKAITSASPGFARIVPVQDIVQALLSRSLDQLRAYFDQFNSFVSADVDTDFLMKVSQNPRGVASLFKSLWDLSGHMRTLR